MHSPYHFITINSNIPTKAAIILELLNTIDQESVTQSSSLTRALLEPKESIMAVTASTLPLFRSAKRAPYH